MGAKRVIMGVAETGQVVVSGFYSRPRTTAVRQREGATVCRTKPFPFRGKVGEPQAQSEEWFGFQPLFMRENRFVFTSSVRCDCVGIDATASASDSFPSRGSLCPVKPSTCPPALRRGRPVFCPPVLYWPGRHFHHYQCSCFQKAEASCLGGIKIKKKPLWSFTPHPEKLF